MTKIDRAISILARSLVRDLREQGYDHRHVVQFASELIALTSLALRAEREAPTGEP